MNSIFVFVFLGGSFFSFLVDISLTVTLCQKLKKANHNCFLIQNVHFWQFLGEFLAKIAHFFGEDSVK